MDKAQAINTFWNSFGLKAYDENTVPQNVAFPYITYNVATDSLDRVVNMYGNLWYRSTTWKNASEMAQNIAEVISNGGKIIKIDKGYMYVCRGTPFAQRMNDPDDSMIRRIYINIQAEFLTAD